jgi:hypothetical protein
MLKLLVAGSRSITDSLIVCKVLDNYGKRPDEIVSGLCNGPDDYGRLWAMANGIHVERFPAKWDDLTTPGAIIVKRKDGTKYNKRAGFDRNKLMADYATKALIFWDGKSRGTKNMISLMKKAGKEVTIIHCLTYETNY